MRKESAKLKLTRLFPLFISLFTKIIGQDRPRPTSTHLALASGVMVGCYKSDIQKLVGNVILSESLAMMHRLLEDFMSTYHPSLDTLLCLQEPKLIAL